MVCTAEDPGSFSSFAVMERGSEEEKAPRGRRTRDAKRGFRASLEKWTTTCVKTIKKREKKGAAQE